MTLKTAQRFAPRKAKARSADISLCASSRRHDGGDSRTVTGGNAPARIGRRPSGTIL
ncbi:predicted protein [Streptomyces sp. AA4]|nr:predicted protein [Streptomyces sp. AA4]